MLVAAAGLKVERIRPAYPKFRLARRVFWVEYDDMKIDGRHCRFRAVREADLPVLAQLFPELADFDVPEKRNPDHLWAGDFKLAEQIVRGDADASFCEVLEEVSNGAVQGVILVSMRGELLSGAPSAHLEAIAVHPQARGHGAGEQLLARAESRAAELGAGSMSLHVFERNGRARGLYEKAGYDEELIRCIKWL